MKYVLLLLLIPSLNLCAQDEGLQDQVTQLYQFKREAETNIQNIQLNLTKSHSSYKTGIGFMLAGTALTIASVFLIDPDGAAPVKFLAGTGFALQGIGVVFVIRSHRFIGKAGERK